MADQFSEPVEPGSGNFCTTRCSVHGQVTDQRKISWLFVSWLISHPLRALASHHRERHGLLITENSDFAQHRQPKLRRERRIKEGNRSFSLLKAPRQQLKFNGNLTGRGVPDEKFQQSVDTGPDIQESKEKRECKARGKPMTNASNYPRDGSKLHVRG
ncbi:hypothetical protein BT69DRAFT_1325518 [Atractiella rhizophila]|nr:hypothetical protein BT69DRAFT_1325518 [Atractiella rhizophila]